MQSIPVRPRSSPAPSNQTLDQVNALNRVNRSLETERLLLLEKEGQVGKLKEKLKVTPYRFIVLQLVPQLEGVLQTADSVVAPLL